MEYRQHMGDLHYWLWEYEMWLKGYGSKNRISDAVALGKLTPGKSYSKVGVRLLSVWHRLSFGFKWYDLWIGAYYDKDFMALYVCPLPMCVIRIDLRKEW